MIRSVVVSLILVAVAFALIYRAGTSWPSKKAISNDAPANVSLLCAAGLAPVMTELVDAFESTVKVDVSYKGSAQLVALHQIAQAGDLLIAADTFYHQTLVDQELCTPAAIVAYQTPCLIISDTVADLESPLEALMSDNLRTSIPKRDHSAIGRLVASIEGEEKYDAFTRRATVTRETVSQVAGDVDQGIVDVGIGWNTTPRQYENTQSRHVEAWRQHRSSVGISILSSAKNVLAAQEFKRFMRGNVAKSIWRQHGYATDDIDSAEVQP